MSRFLSADIMDADFRWLTSSDAKPWLEFASNQLKSNGSELTVLQQLRKQITPERSRLVLTLAKLRKKAKRKFSHATEMFFDDVGLQQSSSQTIAEWKARRFQNAPTIYDLCCGIGGDLLGLANIAPTIAVDSDAQRCEFTQANLKANQLTADVLQQSVEEVEIPGSAWIHIDPARRSDVDQQVRRTTRLEFYQPPQAYLEKLFSEHEAVAVKLAPATDTPGAWEEEYERQWIGHDNQCKQQVVWSGKLAQAPGCSTAVVITSDGAHEFIPTPVTEYRVHRHATECGSYIYEPHAAIRAANIEVPLAESLNAQMLPTHPSFFTAQDKLVTPFATGFEVLKVTSKKSLTSDLKALNPGRIEFKCRPPYQDVEKCGKAIKLKGKDVLTVIAIPIHDKLVVLICRRF